MAIGAAIRSFGRVFRRTSFFAFAVPASLTVEAALALPICLSVLLLLTGLFQAVSVYESVDNQLCMAAKKAAACSVAEDGISRGEVLSIFYEGAADSGIDTSRVSGGLAGIIVRMPESGENNGIIRIEADYRIKLPGFMLGSRAFMVHDSISSRIWTGVKLSKDVGKSAAADKGKIAYVAENGIVYHKDPDCTYLLLSVRAVSSAAVPSLRNMYGSRYTPCERCAHGGMPGTVYITSQGNVWHSDRGCSGLKRSISTMTEKDALAKGLHACPRCGGD